MGRKQGGNLLFEGFHLTFEAIGGLWLPRDDLNHGCDKFFLAEGVGVIFNLRRLGR